MTTGICGDLVQVPLSGEVDLDAAEAAPLAGFQLAGCRPPLFVMRSWSEEVRGYRYLVSQMDSEQPLITVGPPDGDRRGDFPRTVDEWTDVCLERLAPLELPDPILLGGWSFGGVLALEVGRKLERAGRRVALVAMLDTRLPTKHPNKQKNKGRSLPHALVYHLNQTFETDPGKRGAYLKERIAWQAFHARRRVVELWSRGVGRDAPVLTNPDGRLAQERDVTGMSPLQRALWTAYLKYEPRESTIPMTLLWCAESCETLDDATLGWSGYQRGPFASVPLPGNHMTLFGTEHTAAVGQALQRSLEDALR